MSSKYPNFLRNLKDIFLCKVNDYLGEKDYPISLIPQIHYKAKIDIDSLAKGSGAYLVRRSDLPFEDTFNRTKRHGYTLKSDVINESDISGLSLNLLGGDFQVEHLKYRILPKTDAQEKWEFNRKVFISEHYKEYELQDVTCEYYFSIGDINKIIFSYEYPYEKSNPSIENFFKVMGRENAEVFKDDNSSKKVKLPGRIKVHHDPLNMNYWHAEIHVYDYNDNKIERGAKWTKFFFASAINILSVYGVHRIGKIENFEDSVYMKLK